MTNHSPPPRSTTTAPVPDPNTTRVAAKKARYLAMKQSHTPPRVRVLPANEDIRRTMKHPRGMAFREAGAVEWPLDSFTHRRLNDGSVVREEKREERTTQAEPVVPRSS